MEPLASRERSRCRLPAERRSLGRLRLGALTSVVSDQIAGSHHWVTLFTAMYMHGSWAHVLGNMVFLWTFGPAVEDAHSKGSCPVK